MVLQAVQKAYCWRLLLVRSQEAYSHGRRWRGCGTSHVRGQREKERDGGYPTVFNNQILHKLITTHYLGEGTKPFMRYPPPRSKHLPLGPTSNIFNMRFGGDTHPNHINKATEMWIKLMNHIHFFTFVESQLFLVSFLILVTFFVLENHT